MAFITIALVVLASGWLFSRTWLRSRYMALKEAGHPQYFASSIGSVWLMALAASVRKTVSFLWSDYSTWERAGIGLLPQGLVPLENANADVDFAACAMWCLVLAVFIPWLLNLPLRHDKRLLRAVLKRAGAFDAIEHITTHALDCGLPIAVTLKNKKVYIGAPISISPIETERKWLVLFPILSGARDDQSNLTLTVNYGEAYIKFQSEYPDDATHLINEFRVVLSVAEIVSIQTFNIETYQARLLGLSQNTSSQGELKTVTAGEIGAAVLATSPGSEAIQRLETDIVSDAKPGVVVGAKASVVEKAEATSVHTTVAPGRSDAIDDTSETGSPNAVDAFTPEEQLKMNCYYAFAIVLTFAILAMSLYPVAALPLLLLAAILAQASMGNDHPEVS